MGNFLFDQYTLLHFAVGIVSYFWNISFWHWVIIHFVFEILENTELGINFINNNITFWPGGKPKADSLINQMGDNIGGILGWLSAKWLDKFGNDYGWYQQHLA